MQSLRDYYDREFNVRLMPFSKDKKGWQQLIDVVEYLSSEIHVGATLPLAKRLEMEALLND